MNILFMNTCFTILIYYLFQCVFFSTKHEYTFSSLQLSVGFLLQENFEFYRAGVLVFMNTVGSDMLCVLLVSYMSAISYTIINEEKDRVETATGKENCSRGEYILHQVSVLVCIRLLLMGCSMLCVVIHQSHLMLWAIFLPKFLFNCAFYAVYVCLYMCMYCFSQLYRLVTPCVCHQ